MSGGEKARLALSLIVWQKPNLLLLDEPSNHLDVETREALTQALAEFGGSMLLVSHDRHLLRTTVDSFWIVAHGAVQAFDGDLEDYKDWLADHQSAERKRQAQNEASPTQSIDSADPGPDRKQQKRIEAETRQKLAALRKPLEKKMAALDQRLQATQDELGNLDKLIADPALYEDSRKQERITTLARHGELSKQRDALEEQWLELQEAIDTMVYP